MLRNVVSLDDRDAGLNDRVVFPLDRGMSDLYRKASLGDLHITPGHHVVDLLNTEPVKDVRHQGLETHVLHSSDELCRLEVLVCGVAAALAQVVHKVPEKGPISTGDMGGKYVYTHFVTSPSARPSLRK